MFCFASVFFLTAGALAAQGPVDSAAEDQDSVQPVRPDEPQAEPDKPEQTELPDTLVRLLEVAVQNGGQNDQGPESMNSLLGSVRLTNSIVGGQTELFKETHKSRPIRSVGAFRYSHQFSDGAFIGIYGSRGAVIRDERRVFGTKNSFDVDRMDTTTNQLKITFGAGPLNYLASSSGEFTIGYQVDENNGPYTNIGLRLPTTTSTGALSSNTYNYFLGYGNVHYRTESFCLDTGFSGSGEYVGMYGKFGMQAAFGHLVMGAWGQDRTALFSGTVSRQTIQTMYVKFRDVSSILFTTELGLLFKITDRTALRVGGYYQLAALTLERPQGYYVDRGVVSEIKSAVALSSAASRHEDGFYGATFGVVQRL